jgi:ABC transporter substrate-binding protein (ThiB subfamily)
VDYGFVNLNADSEWFAANGIPLPQALEDLTDPAYKGLFVAPNPATSSPGLAFLLATIDHFGEDGYLDFWRALKANDVLITDGWSEAYFEHFTAGSGGDGDRPLVVSYSTSPPADVVYATDGRTAPASVNLFLPESAFRQVEFVGVLQGAAQPELARQFVDFMLDTDFQADIPLQMFVYPANPSAALPELFTPLRKRRLTRSSLTRPRSRSTVNAGCRRGRMRDESIELARIEHLCDALPIIALYALPLIFLAVFYLYPLLAILRVSIGGGSSSGDFGTQTSAA